ncbi:hypothetical protein OS493_039063 [Desmophyllum pertusum]|uniref:PiggyBac transposable element-derived protein domain-containing protein n=1 Tax=Desmophyllum pertusum TaxID=174260 RepID=A0A9W9YVC2_9CNID|nr:hypothetical protein OS493_039063 [Desmophyllum pertusum]
MQAFIGLHVLFGYHKLPETALYWSKEETLGVAYVKKVMPRDSIVNAHILETEAQNHRSRSQMQFRVELAKMLIGEFSSRLRSVSEGQITNGHWPVEASKERCKRCLKQKRNKFCQMACMACGKRICLECFPNHSENDL